MSPTDDICHGGRGTRYERSCSVFVDSVLCGSAPDGLLVVVVIVVVDFTRPTFAAYQLVVVDSSSVITSFCVSCVVVVSRITMQSNVPAGTVTDSFAIASPTTCHVAVDDAAAPPEGVVVTRSLVVSS